MNLRVLYLFAGPRRKHYEDYKKGKTPGIDLVGLDQMSNYGIAATFLENRLTEFLRKISFNLVQLPVLFQLRSCDVIFAGSGVFTLFIIKFIFRLKRPKWIIYNTYLTNLLKRNTKGLKAWIIKKAIFSADAIVSPSSSQSDFLASIGLPPEKNYCLPYGIDYDFFDKQKEEVKTVDRYIFSSGRDVGRDYRTLIEAVKDLPVNLLIATLPRNLNGVGEWPANVSVSHFDQIKMTSLLKGAEFVVIPTISEEELVGSDCSGQYALLRSMACGKAIITSARSTLTDYFSTGQHGLTFSPGKVEELRRAILLLWNNPIQAKVMGKAGRSKIETQLSINIFAERLAKIFYEVATR